jgi:hypothetical protein
LHLCKIDLADEVLVLDCNRFQCDGCGVWCDSIPGPCNCGVKRTVRPYVGDSTRREIAYAQAHGKRVRYLSQEQGG